MDCFNDFIFLRLLSDIKNKYIFYLVFYFKLNYFIRLYI